MPKQKEIVIVPIVVVEPAPYLYLANQSQSYLPGMTPNVEKPVRMREGCVSLIWPAEIRPQGRFRRSLIFMVLERSFLV